MKYEQRIAIIRRELIELLSRFSAPRGMTEEGQGQMVESIADALNRKLPVGNEDQFRENLSLTFAAVLDGHDSYAWPPQASFVKHISRRGAAPVKAPETFAASSRDESAAKLMREGAAVPEAFVWGPASGRLLSGLVDRATLDRYREGSVRQYLDLYRSDAAKVMEGRFGAVVHSYFGRDAA
ncbi:hypothetical protein ATO5_02755 [Loktanella sp. 22II-4b]|nr:hypothetical protein [Brevirhabdus pacifica]OWU79935.1 hypothetical protein ATO5_02755 [Loktanella sp. 22II-4b]PJJ86830.1 hypothetical protein CLV77_1388 [Brevirhabdus pacifica]